MENKKYMLEVFVNGILEYIYSGMLLSEALTEIEELEKENASYQYNLVEYYETEEVMIDYTDYYDYI